MLGPNMSHQTILSDEYSIAFDARLRWLASMGIEMSLQRRLCREGFRTFIALEWFDASVQQRMFHQILLSREALIANFTCKGDGTLVHEFLVNI